MVLTKMHFCAMSELKQHLGLVYVKTDCSNGQHGQTRYVTALSSLKGLLRGCTAGYNTNIGPLLSRKYQYMLQLYKLRATLETKGRGRFNSALILTLSYLLGGVGST